MAFAMRAFASVALAQENQPTANAPEASTERVILPDPIFLPPRPSLPFR